MNPRNYQQEALLRLHASVFAFTRDNMMNRGEPESPAGRRILELRTNIADGVYDAPTDESKGGSTPLCDSNYNLLVDTADSMLQGEASRKNITAFMARALESVIISTLRGDGIEGFVAQVHNSFADLPFEGTAKDVAVEALATLVEILATAGAGIDTTVEMYDRLLSSVTSAGLNPVSVGTGEAMPEPEQEKTGADEEGSGENAPLPGQTSMDLGDGFGDISDEEQGG